MTLPSSFFSHMTLTIFYLVISRLSRTYDSFLLRISHYYLVIVRLSRTYDSTLSQAHSLFLIYINVVSTTM